MRIVGHTRHPRAGWAAALLLVLGIGCGYIADKDRIVIATLDGQSITRGDLAKLIYDMPDDERPVIRNRGDLLRVLNNHIDDRIRVPLADDTEKALGGKPLVAREAAKKRYFKEHAEDDYISMYTVDDPGKAGMTQAQLDIVKQQIDLAIDEVHNRLRGEAAVAVRALEAFKNGTLTATDAEYGEEYRLRKEELKRLEWMQFRAFRFPAELPGAETEAATVRRRLDSGEAFAALYDEYAKTSPDWVLTSEIENNPGLEKFRGFWLTASGAEKGAVLGPVYMPEYQVMKSGEDGRSAVLNMPAAYMVFEVLGHRPETPLALDEAKPLLAPTILVAKMMTQLRTQHGVVILEDKLPDPAMFGGETMKPAGML